MGEAEQLTHPLLGRWEELQVLASEPPERHLLFAGDADDAANGLYSTLSDPVCTATAPGDPEGPTSMPMPLAWTTVLSEEDKAVSGSTQGNWQVLHFEITCSWCPNSRVLSRYLQAAES